MQKREFEITLRLGAAEYTTQVTGIGALLTTLEQTMAALDHDSTGILDTILDLSEYLDDPAPIDFVAADDIYVKTKEIVEKEGVKCQKAF